MKPIILDHLRRWWWLWVFCLVSHLSFIAILGLISSDKFHAVFPIGTCMGAILLSIDLQRGHTRSLVTMPASLKQVARAWWWVSVGLPAVAIILVTAVEFAFFHERFKWTGFAPICLSNLLALGAGFYALTGFSRTHNYYGGWKTYARAYFFGAVWGLSFGGWLILQNFSLIPIAWLGLLIIALFFTVMGWFRAEFFVEGRSATQACESILRPKKPTHSRTAEGHGGLTFLAQNIFMRIAYMAVAMFVAFAVIMTFLVFQLGSTDAMGVTPPILSVQFLFVTTFQFVAFGGHIRFLRTMPISTTKLAAVLVFTVLVTMLVMYYAGGVLLSVFLRAPLPGLETMIEDGGLLQIAAATCIVPLFVWRPLGILTFMILLILMIGSAVPIMIEHRLPMGISVSSAVLVVTAAFFITKALLERSSHAYRPRVIDFGAWNCGATR